MYIANFGMKRMFGARDYSNILFYLSGRTPRAHYGSIVITRFASPCAFVFKPRNRIRSIKNVFHGGQKEKLSKNYCNRNSKCPQYIQRYSPAISPRAGLYSNEFASRNSGLRVF